MWTVATNKFQRRRVVWSRANNLTLNHAKSVEIIFRDDRKRCCIYPPSPLQGIAHVTSLKVPGTRRHTYWQTVCHCARGWRRRLACAVHVRHQRTAVSRHGSRQLCSGCSAQSSSLRPKLTYAGPVGLYDLRRPTAYQCCSASSCSIWPVNISWDVWRAYVRGPLYLSWWWIVHQN